jgi:hypothetical protein
MRISADTVVSPVLGDCKEPPNRYQYVMAVDF